MRRRRRNRSGCWSAPPIAPTQEAPDAADAGDVAAVLDHGVDAAGVARRRDDVARILRGRGHRLFGEHVAAVAKAVSATRARGRHDHVEHDVGPGPVEHRVEVGADHGVVEAELAGAPLGAPEVDVDQPDDGEAVPRAASSQAQLMAPQPTRTA